MATAVDADAQSGAEGAGAPSPLGRVLLTFGAPSRAFAHLGKGKSWWLPYVLIVIVGLLFSATVGSRVGWDAVARNNLANSPRQQAALDKAPPAQQEQQLALVARITRTTAFIAPFVAPLIIGAIVAGVLLATLNFGLGGTARFGPLFAVYMFSAMPALLKSLLAIIMLLFGVGGESFQINNPLGSNPGFYMQGAENPRWLTGLLSWADVFLIWQLVVLAIGCAIVARVSRGRSFAVVFGWTLLCSLGGAAISAVS